MRAARRVCLLVLVLALMLVLPSTGGAQTSSSTEVAGRVVSAGGAGVAGADVVLRSRSGAEAPAVADREGAFRFEAVAPGDYVVSASAIGMSPAVQPLRVSVGQAPLSLTLVLPHLVHERVNVVAHTSTIERIPGSAHVIDRTEMEKLRVGTDDVHRMLRQVPGLNMQEEEGFGLRPNIGMRGSGTDRSSKITLMEDGVLVAPAPYAAPAAYYSPVPGRMESLEIRKGSSQIKYGPITTGGVLNYVSTGIPTAFRIRGDVTGGGHDTRRVLTNIGDSYANVGWLVETYQLRNNGFKQLDGGGKTGVAVQDYLAKLRFNTTPTTSMYQELEIKLGRTEQEGHETYLGLTDADFALTPLRRYAASQKDLFRSTHEQYQVRHLLARRSWDVTTVAYRNNFQRSWYKLQSVEGSGPAGVLAAPERFPQQMATLTGVDSAPDALVVRDNSRTYYGTGVQSVLGVALDASRVQHELEVGLRYHQDEEDRFQHDDAYRMTGGRMILTSAGAPGSQTNAVVGARAIAGFVSDTITWDRWSLSPGIRYESIDLEHVDYARTDPSRHAPTGARNSAVTVAVPGVGLSYTARPGVALFGGIHRGFAPPGPGLDAHTRAEDSVNYELGARVARGGVRTEVVSFFNDYSNLLGRDTLSAGGTGEGDLFNGGDALVYGLELSGQWNPLDARGSQFSIPVRLAYTFTNAEFRNSFASPFGPWGEVQTGDELPYVPRHQAFFSVDLDRQVWRARLDANYVGPMRTAAGQGAFLATQATDAYLVVGLSGEYSLGASASLFASIQNLTDNTYIVGRHPQGVRPGLPRAAMAGVRFLVGR